MVGGVGGGGGGGGGQRNQMKGDQAPKRTTKASRQKHLRGSRTVYCCCVMLWLPHSTMTFNNAQKQEGTSIRVTASIDFSTAHRCCCSAAACKSHKRAHQELDPINGELEGGSEGSRERAVRMTWDRGLQTRGSPRRMDDGSTFNRTYRCFGTCF